MDSFVAALPALADADLMLADGVAYQADMSAGRVEYGADYLAKVDNYDGTPIAEAVNAGRCALVLRHLWDGAHILDLGAGSGAFVRAARSWGIAARGYDVMPGAVQRLIDAGLYAEPNPARFDAVCLWDVLEHLEEPAPLLHSIPVGRFLFVSLPIFDDLRAIRASRHYRPGEHLYYWTADAFVGWMGRYGFRLLERSSHEMDAGRDSIGAFAFVRDDEMSRHPIAIPAG